jgi:hypothetical protein
VSLDSPAPRSAAPASPDQDRNPRVVLYSKPGCHLCDDARVVVAEVCGELGEPFEEVDISVSPELLRRYGEEIPVTFVDGRRHATWKVDAGQLREALG